MNKDTIQFLIRQKDFYRELSAWLEAIGSLQDFPVDRWTSDIDQIQEDITCLLLGSLIEK